MTVNFLSRLKNIAKYNIFDTKRHYSISNKWKVLFFGTDEFSLSSLKQIYKEHILGKSVGTLEVVTNIKRKNVVNKFSSEHNLKTHEWPLVDFPVGVYDLGIVVSFGNLIPEKIIQCFPLGILNVHASLLPRWRGAAPIIYTLLNGDTETGITIMRIQPRHFDVGEIVLQKSLSVRGDMLQPELHDRLAELGGHTLIECLRTLPHCLEKASPQTNSLATYAPKISISISNINWQGCSAVQIYNLSRALYNIFPLVTKYQDKKMKLFKLHLWDTESNGSENYPPGCFRYDKEKKVIRVWCGDGQSIYFDTILVPGKKQMTALDFRNGFMKNVPDSELCFSKID